MNMRRIGPRRGPNVLWHWRLCSAALLAAVVCGCAATPKAAERRLAPAEQELNVQSFDQVWQTIHDKHFDPTFGGVDWDAVRAELRPKVAAAATMKAARAAMNEAIDRLRLSHFAIIPHEAYEALSGPAGEDREGEIGLAARVLGGQALVTEVRPGSPAAENGVQPGWQIARIAGRDLAPLIEQVAAAYEDSTLQQAMLMLAIEGRLKGAVGETVEIEFIDGHDQAVRAALTRTRPEGLRAVFGNLPPMYVFLESRRLEGNLGYIRLSSFFEPSTIMKQFEEAVSGFVDADGIVIDLRGNPGGLGAMAAGLSGFFVEESNQHIGTMHARQMEFKLVVFPRAETYAGPLAVLIDGCSGSTAEFMAGGLQALGRAHLFGMRSAGAALPSAIEKLPNGDGFQYAMGDYITASGRRLEGHGVVPDVDVVPTRAQLLAGRDPILAAAVDWIRSQK